jgi:hypothetical protein
LPSVAETSVRSAIVKLTGSAPVWRTSARSFASFAPARPVIRALPPLIPPARVESV